MRSSRLIVLTTALTVLATALIATTATATASATTSAVLVPAVAHDIAVGDDFVCVRKSDRTLSCTGNDSQQQVSGASAVTGAMAIAAYGQTACAIVGSGSVHCWGANTNGQASPPANITNAVQVVLFSLNGCALLADGHVTCWGQDSAHVVSGASSVSNLTQISLSTYFGCGVDTSFTLKCWGTPNLPFGAPPGSYTSVTLTSNETCVTNLAGHPSCYSSGAFDNTTPNLTSVENASNGSDCGLSAGSGVVVCQGSGIVPLTPKSGYLEIAAGPSSVCGLDASGLAHCARPTGGTGALVPPTDAAGPQGPAAATAATAVHGVNDALVSYTSPSQTQPTTYVVTNGPDTGAPSITCLTTASSCLIPTTQGSNSIRVTAVSRTGVAAATPAVKVTGVSGAATYVPTAVGVSGVTAVVAPSTPPLSPQPLTVTGAVSAGTAPISGNRDFALVSAGQTIAQTWSNVAPNSRAQQDFSPGLSLCDPVNLPTDTSTCAAASDQWALTWTGQVSGQDLPPGQYTLEYRAAGSADPYVPIDGANTLTVTSPAPVTLTAEGSLTGDPLTCYGPNASGVFVVKVAGAQGLVVPFSGTVDLYDSSHTLVTHWDLPQTTTGVAEVIVSGLAIGDYTAHVSVNNTYGSLTQDFPVSVVVDTLTGVTVESPVRQVYPYVDGWLDTTNMAVTPHMQHDGPAPDGAVTISQNGQVLLTIPISGNSPVVKWNGAINGQVTFGTYDVQAVYTQNGTTVSSTPIQIEVLTTAFRNVTIRPWDPVAYPYKDGYIDSASFVIDAPGTVPSMPFTSGSLTISQNGATIAVVPVTSLTDHAVWDGLNNGAIVPGTYTATVTLYGGDGPPATASTTVDISAAHLYLKHMTTSLTAAGAQLACSGTGQHSCKPGIALLGKKKLHAEVYTVGPHAKKDGVLALNAVEFPTSVFRINRWSLQIVGRADSAGFALFYCDSTRTAKVVTCTGAGKFKNKQQAPSTHPWVTPWTNKGIEGSKAEWLILGTSKGSLSVVNYKVLVDYYILK